MKKPTPVSISVPAVAVPPGAMSVRRAAELTAAAHSLDRKDATRLHAMARLSGVRMRHAVVFDGSSDPDASETPFYSDRPKGAPQNPTTAERMDVYAREAPRLAAEAAQNALHQEKLNPSAVTHLVVTSSTGFFAPGLDCALVRDLQLQPDVQRVSIGFAGSHGALNACATAQSLVANRPGAVALLVSVELCSLHFRFDLDRDSLVSNFLFADGAAAAVIRPETTTRRSSLRLLDAASHYFPDSDDVMTWTVGDAGFRMTLDKSVSRRIEEGLRPVVESFLRHHRLRIRDVAGWAIHPERPRILDAIVDALKLPAKSVEVSRGILQSHGNMSSATVLFVLREMAELKLKGPILALAFGPGLVAEMALLQSFGEKPVKKIQAKARKLVSRSRGKKNQ